MRYLLLTLLLAASASNAAHLELTVSEGQTQPTTYTYPLSGDLQSLDLRSDHRYDVAIKDDVRNKEICREADYRTGMMLSLRYVDPSPEGKYQIEILGQISSLSSIDVDATLSCGVNQTPTLEYLAFSETSILEIDKTKVLVIDGQTTLLLTIKE
tara:strand:+ start:10694 stop:11158 length:465 start_codon:yes stop_codon:yes gene_type:complete